MCKQREYSRINANITAGSKVILTDGSEDVDVVTATDDDTDIDGLNGIVTNAILNARIDAATVKPIRMDPSTHTIQTIKYEHHEIHSGSHYFVQSIQDLAINNVLDFTWQMPNTAKWIHWTWDIDTEKETAWYVYEVAVATNPLANTVTPVNSNRNSANTSGTTMKYELQASLAAANIDTDVTGATLLSSGISGVKRRLSGSAERNHEVVLKQNTLYCLRAVAAAAGYINFNMQWYEHTDKD